MRTDEVSGSTVARQAMVLPGRAVRPGSSGARESRPEDRVEMSSLSQIVSDAAKRLQGETSVRDAQIQKLKNVVQGPVDFSDSAIDKIFKKMSES